MPEEDKRSKKEYHKIDIKKILKKKNESIENTWSNTKTNSKMC